MTALERALGHRFGRPDLLEAALVHSSYASERAGLPDNERMEFLGDAVLQLAVTEHLFMEYSDLREGQMAKVRAGVVNREVLAAVAREVGLGPRLHLGLGEEQSGGRTKDSILADAMEAVIAAVYLDAGYTVAARVVLALWAPYLRERASDPGRRDFKTRYQELLAAAGKRPVYQVSAEGPDHERVFAATVSVDGRVTGSGSGRSKKDAEQAAARAALQGE